MTQLEPLEIACGTVLEPLRLPSPMRARRPRRRPAGAARRALETAVLDAMTTGQLSLSFSGGRDSSLLLAVATHVARREGLADPLPVTLRHPSPDSLEQEDQELVVRHLGLTEWITVEVGDTLDLLGDVGTRTLERDGLLAPPNTYLHRPLLDAAPAGCLLTGGGGDEVLGTTAWRLAEVVARRERPRARDAARLAFAVAPSPVRRRLAASRVELDLPWLTDAAAAEVRRRFAAEEVRTRLRWDRGAVLYSRSRTVRLANAGYDGLGEGRVRVRRPLADTRFVEAFAGEVGLAGPGDRTRAMQLLGGDVLPGRTIARPTKASFGGLIWGPRFRAFVESWDPATLEPRVRDLVDVDALRQEWRRDGPVYQSMLLAQRAWLDQRAASPS